MLARFMAVRKRRYSACLLFFILCVLTVQACMDDRLPDFAIVSAEIDEDCTVTIEARNTGEILDPNSDGQASEAVEFRVSDSASDLIGYHYEIRYFTLPLHDNPAPITFTWKSKSPGEIVDVAVNWGRSIEERNHENNVKELSVPKHCRKTLEDQLREENQQSMPDFKVSSVDFDASCIPVIHVQNIGDPVNSRGSFDIELRNTFMKRYRGLEFQFDGFGTDEIISYALPERVSKWWDESPGLLFEVFLNANYHWSEYPGENQSNNYYMSRLPSECEKLLRGKRPDSEHWEDDLVSAYFGEPFSVLELVSFRVDDYCRLIAIVGNTGAKDFDESAMLEWSTWNEITREFVELTSPSNLSESISPLAAGEMKEYIWQDVLLEIGHLRLSLQAEEQDSGTYDPVYQLHSLRYYNPVHELHSLRYSVSASRSVSIPDRCRI